MKSRVGLVLGVVTTVILCLGASWSMVEVHAGAERDKLGWSQERMAEACDLSRVYISQLERGLRNPTVLAFMRIARALELKPSSLLRKFEGG